MCFVKFDRNGRKLFLNIIFYLMGFFKVLNILFLKKIFLWVLKILIIIGYFFDIYLFFYYMFFFFGILYKGGKFFCEFFYFK